MSKSIMIRPKQDWELEAIEKAKEITGQTTASKALLRMVEEYQKMEERFRRRLAEAQDDAATAITKLDALTYKCEVSVRSIMDGVNESRS